MVIRHFKAGSTMFYLIQVATRSYNNKEFALCYRGQDGDLEYEYERIPTEQIGWMTPNKGLHGNRQFIPEFSSGDGRQFSTVRHPLTGTVQHSVVHTSLKGTIDDCAPDVDYVEEVIAGKAIQCIAYTDAWDVQWRLTDTTDKTVINWFLSTFSWPVSGPYGDPVLIKTDKYVGYVAPGAIRRTYSYGCVYLASLAYREGSYDRLAKSYYWPSESWSPYNKPPPLNPNTVTEDIIDYLPSSTGYPIGRPIGVKRNPAFPDTKTLVTTLNAWVNTFTWEYERVTHPQVQANYGTLCLQALDEARFIQSNQLEFWKDVGMTFSEFGALKTFAENLTERVLRSPEIKHHAHRVVSAIKSRHKLMKRYRTAPITEQQISRTYLNQYLSQNYLASIAGGQIRDSANTYLSHYYGTRLAVADIEEMSTGLSEFIWTYYSEFRKKARTLHAHMDFEQTTQFGPCKTYQNYNLNYNPYAGISEISEIINELGFGVDFHQIWECIPLSFVIDWCYDITSVLKAIDLQNELTKLSINFEGISSETRIDVSKAVSDRYGFNCNIEYEYYERYYSPVPTIIPSATNLVGKPQRHFIQGAALLCSR